MTLEKSILETEALKLTHSGNLPLDRSAHLALLDTLSFPNPKQEVWKYTDLHKAFPKTLRLADSEESFKAEGYDLVLHNGQLVSVHSDKMKVTRLGDMDDSEKQKMAAEMERVISYQPDYFFHLNSAASTGGLVIEISGENNNFRILHHADGGNSVSFPRIFIKAAKNSRSNIVIDFTSAENASVVIPVIQVLALENAYFQLVKIQRESDHTIHCANDTIFLGKGTTAALHTTTLSGKSVRNTVYAALPEPNAHCELTGIYIPERDERVDHRTVIDHISPHCTSDELYKGVMAGKSVASFNGKVFVRQEAQKTNAFQRNQNIILSDFAVANSKPELEIYADDVKCSHGSTTGQFDEEALFYLRSRGIGELNGRKLLIGAFMDEATAKVRSEETRERLSGLLDSKFADLL